MNTDGLALVSGNITGASSRAVVTVEAFNTTASFGSCRIAYVSAGCRTGAFGCVIVCYTNCVETATDSCTSGQTLANASFTRLTRFSVRALRVRLTLVFGNGSASVAIVGVSSESSTAFTLALVIGRTAIGVRWTGETGADGQAFPDA